MLTSFKDRDTWIRDVLADAELSMGERACAVRLALFLNIDQRECTPSYDGIAKALAVSKRTAIRLVAGLMRRGWLAEPTSHGWARNNFYLMRPYDFRRGNGDSRGTVNGDRGDTVERPNGDKSRHSTVTNRASPHTPHIANSEENSEERIRDSDESLFPATDQEVTFDPNRHQEESAAKDGKAKTKRRRFRTPLPNGNLVISEDWRVHALANGMPPDIVDREFGGFVDYHRSRANSMADWKAAWGTWVRNGFGWRDKPNRASGRKKSFREAIYGNSWETRQ